MKKLLIGSLAVFVSPLCGAVQPEHPNIIYVFSDQFRNQALGFWNEAGFREKINFKGDPVHTPHLNTFARESMVLTSAVSNFVAG